MDLIDAMFEDDGNNDAVIIGQIVTYDEYVISGNMLHIERAVNIR